MRIRLGRIIKRTANELEAYFKGHWIHIQREYDDRFYIRVDAPSGSACYDGWWPREPVYPRVEMKEAIEQALRGSLLITDSKDNKTG